MTKTTLMLWVPAISGALAVSALAATGNDSADRQAAAEYQQEMVDAGHWEPADHDAPMETR